MTYTRTIILKKEVEENKILGFFITEHQHKKVCTTEIETVEANIINKKVTYLKKETIEELKADELIKRYILEGYYIRKDEITEHNGARTGFRIVNNLTQEVIGSYNWEVTA